MEDKKRPRAPYSQLSREQKDILNQKKRALRLRQIERENALLTIEVQAEMSRDENIDSMFSDVDIREDVSTHGYKSVSTHPIIVDNAGPSTQPSIPNNQQECELSDVPIGIAVGTLMMSKRLHDQPIPTESLKLPNVEDCRFCHAKRFPYETVNFCCSGGEVNLYPIVIPQQLQKLYSGLGSDSTHFLQYIMPYNDIFAFTSMGVNLDPMYAKRLNGIYTFRAQGQIYHFINALYPTDQRPSYLQLYFYDTDKEVSNRKGKRDKLQEHIISLLINIVAENPYTRFFRSLRNMPNIKEYQICLRADPPMDASNASPPTVSQVAAIWIENDNTGEQHERDIIVQKHDGHSQRISHYYGCYDSLQYPLLFPMGEPGWHEGIEKLNKRSRQRLSTSQARIIASHAATSDQLIATEETVRQENARKRNTVTAREFYTFRFQIRKNPDSLILRCGRLLQQFVVDMYVKIETSRLDFFRKKQAEIRADLYQGVVDSVNQGESDASKIGKRIVLPSSFIGGPRDMRKRYLDAMTLVERYGKPDLFLTMTCNPNWPEIKAELQPHEEAQNRPDLISRVFRSKLEHLRREVIMNKLFGPVAAYTFVVEFQKRGLPHVHMLLILKNGFKLNTIEQFDAFISAELPDKEKYPHLYAMVVKHMMHGPCGTLNVNNPCMQTGKCKNHYPRKFSQRTCMSADSYPIYRRRQDGEQVKVRGHLLDNRWVVPYNPYLLAMFDCHINVEICSTVKAVKYLYKYIYKGHDKIIYRLATMHTDDTIDEIQDFQAARWISPPEGIWRIYRFPLHDMKPAVISLPLHLEGCQMINFKKDANLRSIAENEFLSRTMLTQFFWMNANNAKAKSLKLLYKDFPQEFVWDTQSRTWNERKQKEVIGRIITASPSEGERYYLRLLLTYIPAPTSYANLRTINGLMYQSFREAANAHGLLDDDQANKKCMEEASVYRMPISLRQLFCTILVYCAPVNPKELYFKFQEDMAQDYTFYRDLTQQEQQQKLLEGLNAELESMGRCLADFQLDKLVDSLPTNNTKCKEIEDELSLHVSEEDLQRPAKLNSEQQIAYHEILDAVFNNKPKSFFIDGPGGTGKTFLYRALLATVRSQQKIALATASSGVAASILPNGRTAHSRFKIPIDAEGNICCSVGKQSGLATLLKETALIIWDEASMARKESIEALDQLLQDLTDKDILFGGKVVVLGGDFRQVLPVIPKGTREDCINASLVRSYIWQSLIKLKLKENMRARTDPAFSSYILRIGNGTQPENQFGEVQLPPVLVLKATSPIPALDQLIAFVYPSIHQYYSDPLQITKSAILTPKNSAVDDINDTMLAKFPGKQHMYLSFDETTDPTQQGLYIDFLNSISPPGLPPHKLILKKNCPVILLRNINPAKGLCNGTRLICTEFNQHLICAKIAIGDRAGTTVFIPRIPLRPNSSDQYPVQFTRRQFPIKLCFAMTVNKAQGQTLDTVGLYLPEPVFSHGQLYVGLSRATTATKIKVHAKKFEEDPSSSYYTKNIVYKELLQEANSS